MSRMLCRSHPRIVLHLCSGNGQRQRWHKLNAGTCESSWELARILSRYSTTARAGQEAPRRWHVGHEPGLPRSGRADGVRARKYDRRISLQQHGAAFRAVPGRGGCVPLLLPPAARAEGDDGPSQTVGAATLRNHPQVLLSDFGSVCRVPADTGATPAAHSSPS